MVTFEIIILEKTQMEENWGKIPQAQVILPLLVLGGWLCNLIILLRAIASVQMKLPNNMRVWNIVYERWKTIWTI